MEEIWKDVPGYEGKYQVSINTKECRCRNIKTGRVLSNTPDKGHNRIFWCLYNNGKAKSLQAAVWVAKTYPELVQNEWFDGSEVDHIDTDRLNNHPSNLRWVNRKTNLNNPITKVNMSKSRTNHPKMSKWVIKLSKNNEILHFYPSVRQAARDSGVWNSTITDCCNGKKHTAGGYIWKYAI